MIVLILFFAVFLLDKIDIPVPSKLIKQEIKDGSIKVVIIPDIESVNYGRGVGYEIIEHVPPNQVEQISATKIRAQMRKEGKL